MDLFSKLPNGIFKSMDNHYIVSIYSHDLKKTQFLGKHKTRFAAMIALTSYKNEHRIAYIPKIYTTY